MPVVCRKRAFMLALFILPAFAIGSPAAQALPLPGVVSGSADNTLRIWDSSGKQTANILAHDSSVTCIAVSSDGKTVFSGSTDKRVKQWNADEGSMLNSFDAHDKTVLCMSLSPDGRTLAT